MRYVGGVVTQLMCLMDTRDLHICRGLIFWEGSNVATDIQLFRHLIHLSHPSERELLEVSSLVRHYFLLGGVQALVPGPVPPSFCV